MDIYWTCQNNSKSTGFSVKYLQEEDEILTFFP